MTTTRPSDEAAAWPEQLRLPGQAAAAEGPVDMHMMYVAHHAFRRDLGRFVRAVDVTPVAERGTWQALHRRWRLFGEILHHHHSGEDAGLWPALRARASEEQLAVLDEMEAEHDGIDPLLEACGRAFEELAAAADDETRARLRELVARVRERLSDHLAHEETRAIPIIQDLLTDAEFQAIDEEYFRKRGNPSIRRIALVVAWGLHDLPDDARSRLLAQGGAPLRLVWWIARRGFARLEREAFHRG